MQWCWYRNDSESCADVNIDKCICGQPKQAEVISTIINIVLNLISSLFAVSGNGSICYVILTKERLRTPSYIIIAGLVSADALTGLLVQPLYVAKLIAVLHRRHFCRLEIALDYFSHLFVGCSLLTLFVVTSERWLAVLFPYKQPLFVNNRKCCYCLVGIWFCTNLVTLVYTMALLPQAVIKLAVAVLYGMIIASVLLSYSMIYMVVKRKRRKDSFRARSISRTSSMLNPSVGETSFSKELDTHSKSRSVVEEGKQSPKKRYRHSKRFWKKDYIIGFITIAIIGCHAPKCIEGALTLLTRNDCTAHIVLVSWLNTLVYLNSSINFIIYSYRDKNLWMATRTFYNTAQKKSLVKFPFSSGVNL